MTTLWIAGYLDVDATREERPVEDLGLPRDWINSALPKSPQARALRPDPILLRDRHGVLETLNWWAPNADSPRLSPWDTVEVWVLDQDRLEESPNLIKVIRFCLYQLAKLNSNIKSKKESRKLRHEILGIIDNDRELRSAIARHVLQVEEDDVLQPRNMLPLLGNQIDSRTLQMDLTEIREQAEAWGPDSTQIEGNFGNNAETHETGVNEQLFTEIKTDKTVDPATLFPSQRGENLSEKKAIDSTAEDKISGRENHETKSGNDKTEEPLDSVEEETPQTNRTSSDMPDLGRPSESPSEDAPHEENLPDEEKETEKLVGVEPPTPEAIERASQIYGRLQKHEAVLPDFDSVIRAFNDARSKGGLKAKKAFVDRLIAREAEIESNPKEIIDGVISYLQRGMTIRER